METGLRGKSLFGNIPWTGEEEPSGRWLGHFQGLQQRPGVLCSPVTTRDGRVKGTDTTRRGWHRGGNRWNWGLASWGKVWGQELHSALHGLNPTQPTQGHHSAPANWKLALTVLEGWIRERKLWQATRGRGSTARVPNASKIQGNHRITFNCPAPKAGLWCHDPTVLASGGIRQLPAGLRRNLSTTLSWKQVRNWSWARHWGESDPVPWGSHFTNGGGKWQHRLRNLSVTVSGSELGFAGKAS